MLLRVESLQRVCGYRVGEPPLVALVSYLRPPKLAFPGPEVSFPAMAQVTLASSQSSPSPRLFRGRPLRNRPPVCRRSNRTSIEIEGLSFPFCCGESFESQGNRRRESARTYGSYHPRSTENNADRVGDFRRAEFSSDAGKTVLFSSFLGGFQQRDYLLSPDAGKLAQEIVYGVSAFQMVEERRDRHPRAGKTRGSSLDVLVHTHHCFFHGFTLSQSLTLDDSKLLPTPIALKLGHEYPARRAHSDDDAISLFGCRGEFPITDQL